MKPQKTWIARLKGLLGYNNTAEVPMDVLLESTVNYYENIIACMPGNVYWMDKDCIAVGCNQNVLDMFGLTLPEFQGLSFEGMGEIAGWSDATTASFKRDTLDVIETGLPKLHVEEPPIVDVKGNTIVFLTHRVPLFDKQKNIIGAVGISLDITDRKRMETALLDEKIKSEAANHAKSEFIANMSHDIRTPLTGITGLSNLIAQNATNLTQKKYAKLLVESSQVLLTMLNHILEMVSAGHVCEHDVQEEAFDFHQLIDDIVRLERPTALSKDLALLMAIDHNIPRSLLGDRTKIHRIILNLVGNAIKFTHKGSVSIHLSLVKEDHAEALVQCSIRDTGIGIPPDMQEKVFDRFFRAHPSNGGLYTGHGIGLHIAQSYAHWLNSEIKLVSQLGVGTTFYFVLRLKNAMLLKMDGASTTATPMTTLAAVKRTESLSPEVIRILLVEDNPIAMLVLKQSFLSPTYHLTTAEDGEIAYNLASSHAFDLIITDLGLPNVTGIEFTKRLRSWEATHQRRSVPIIALTAHAYNDVAQECLDAGMNAILTKPMTIEQLERIKLLCKSEL